MKVRENSLPNPKESNTEEERLVVRRDFTHSPTPVWNVKSLRVMWSAVQSSMAPALGTGVKNALTQPVFDKAA